MSATAIDPLSSRSPARGYRASPYGYGPRQTETEHAPSPAIISLN